MLKDAILQAIKCDFANYKCDFADEEVLFPSGEIYFSLPVQKYFETLKINFETLKKYFESCKRKFEICKIKIPKGEKIKEQRGKNKSLPPFFMTEHIFSLKSMFFCGKRFIIPDFYVNLQPISKIRVPDYLVKTGVYLY